MPSRELHELQRGAARLVGLAYRDLYAFQHTADGDAGAERRWSLTGAALRHCDM